MAIYLLTIDGESGRNSSGIHAAVVDAATEQAARDAADAEMPGGYSTTDWQAAVLDADGALDVSESVILFEGPALAPYNRSRGQ